MNLLPVLTEGASPSPRKLYWRYKGLSQQALRDGGCCVVTAWVLLAVAIPSTAPGDGLETMAKVFAAFTVLWPALFVAHLALWIRRKRAAARTGVGAEESEGPAQTGENAPE